MTLEDSYLAGFSKTAEHFGYDPGLLIKKAGHKATLFGKYVGNYFKYLFGGSPRRALAMKRISQVEGQLNPMLNELKILRGKMKGLDLNTLNSYNKRIDFLNKQIAQAYRSNRNVNIRELEKRLTPLTNEIQGLQKKTRGLDKATFLANQKRMSTLNTDIGKLKYDKEKLYKPIASENRKIMAARVGTLLAGGTGIGMLANNQKEDDGED